MELISYFADFIGILSFIISLFTFYNTRQIKVASDHNRFIMEKRRIVKVLQNTKIVTRTGHIRDNEINGLVVKMRKALDIVGEIREYSIWDREERKVFCDFFLLRMGIDKFSSIPERKNITPSSVSVEASPDQIEDFLEQYGTELDSVIKTIQAKT